MAVWPIDVRALGAAACGARLWRMRGELHVTVVVKATFALVHDGSATRVPPDEVVAKDRHYDRSPARSVEIAGDLAPYKPRADVTLVGHAHLPVGESAPTAAVRLVVFREAALLDKTLHVYGDRADPASPPRPFAQMPLVYERTAGGPHSVWNPVGVGAESARSTNVVDPRDPGAPACFAPVSRYWPARKREIGDSHGIEARIAEIPDEMTWTYFQSAPPDQQIEFLRGDEWIVLDGMHPGLRRVQTRLPSVRGAARVHAVRSSGAWNAGQDLALVADTLAIDSDRQRCSITWRGGFVVPGGDSGLASLRVVMAAATGGAPFVWPPVPPPVPGGETLMLEPDQEHTATIQLDPREASTLTLSPSDSRSSAARPATPFDPTQRSAVDHLGDTRTVQRPRNPGAAPLPDPPSSTPPPPSVPLRAPDIPGAPWSRVPARPAPQPLGEDYATTVLVDLIPAAAPPPGLGRGDPLEPPREPGGDDETTTLHRAPVLADTEPPPPDVEPPTRTDHDPRKSGP